MSPNDLIDDYVASIAMRLPRGQRRDLANELRVLLQDDLAHRAAAEGRAADLAMAHALIAGFGDPESVAKRYRAAGLVLIDPAQSAGFLKASLAGVGLQWAIGIAAAVAQVKAGVPASLVVQKSFLTWGLGALWWPGFLVLSTAAAAWMRQRKADQPNGGIAMKSDRVSRVGIAIVVPLGAICTAFYGAPVWFLTHIAPRSFNISWAIYAPEFRDQRLIPLMLYMSASLALLAFVAVQGRWSQVTRRLAIGVGLSGTAVMSWCVLAGKIFVSDPADRTMRFIMAILVVVSLYDLFKQISRELIFAQSGIDPRRLSQ